MVRHTRFTVLSLAVGLLTLVACSPGPADTYETSIGSGVDETCAQMYAMLTTEVLASKTIAKEQKDAWAQQAKESAAAVREGDQKKAHDLCQKTVDGMTEAGVGQ